MEVITKIKLFEADTLTYAGTINVYSDSRWKFVDVTDEQLLDIGKHLPLKGILHMLISLNMVYDIIPCTDETGADT